MNLPSRLLAFDASRRGRLRRFSVALIVASLLVVAPVPTPPAPAMAVTLPSGFSESVVFSGLTNPTAVEFASDGRVFVAEKSGLIKVFDGLSDPSATVFADLRTNVHNFWDRGLLGMALAPTFPTDPSVYVLYTYDAAIGGVAPRWGTANVTSDPCPSPPGPTSDGCVVSGRLSRLQASGNQAVGGEQVLIEDWCQQYPSHSIGSLVFGADGALYVSGGDGASFTFTDWGQDGNPVNPCGDPPGPPGTALTPPTAEGGALRSQDLRTMPPPPGTSDYDAVISSLAPVARWTLGETSGTTANDSVGSSDGRYENGVTLGQPALVNGGDAAARFDGSNDQVRVPSTPSLNPTTAMSVVAWVNPDAWLDGNRRIIQKGTNDSQWMIRATGSGTRLEFRIAGVTSPGTTAMPALGTRHLIVGTYDGSTARLYVDGVVVTSRGASGAIPVGGTDLTIGNKPGSVVAGDHFDGVIDEVSLHHAALSSAQVASLWTAGTTGGSDSGGTSTDPVTLDGAVLRLDPATGAAHAGNPLASNADPNARRIVAHGFRNPFRFTIRPGTNEIWAGDVGRNTWEEINRISDPTARVWNFGWPCYEGAPRESGFDNANLAICEDLYASPNAHDAPYYAYRHDQKPVADGCPTGGSSISGLAFYEGGNYPVAYQDALFFSDYSRDCIWVMLAGANGLPDPSRIQSFGVAASNPVQLTIGPGGDLFYVDFDGGNIRRIRYTSNNNAPTAVISAVPTSGPAPLAVDFGSAGSSDPDGDPLTFAWDLDNDGAFDDGTGSTASWTYATVGSHIARLRVSDPSGAFDIDTTTISAGNDAPVPVIDSPGDSLTWAVGQSIAFSGHATDAQDGNLPASRLSWSLIVHHCPSNCHTHPIQTFEGVASGTFAAPDHEYPSHLELRLTATDSAGATASTSVLLQPKTVELDFATAPSGLTLTVGGSTQTAPFSVTVIAGSTNTISAPSPQTLGGQSHVFSAWSDGGAATHTITAPATAATYTATFTSSGSPPPLFADDFENGSMDRWTTASSVTVQTSNVHGGTHAARAVSTGSPAAWASRTLTTTTTTLELRSWIHVGSQGSNPAYLYRIISPAGKYLAGIYRNSDGRIRLKNDAGGTGANSAVVFPSGGWHELVWRISVDGASSTSEVWLDGAVVPAVTGTFDFGTVPIERLQIGDNNAGRSYQIDFDDVIALP